MRSENETRSRYLTFRVPHSALHMRVLLVVVLCTCSAASCRAQATNLSIYQDLAVHCLGDLPDTLRAFRLDAPDRMPYLRTALLERWGLEGRSLYAPDSTARPGLPLLSFDVEEAAVAYARDRGGRVRRSVVLALRYDLSGADARLLADDRCRETYTDVFDRRALAGLETGAFPETTAPPPPAGWLRRYAQPALLTAATAIGVYLFFTLRSQATE